MSITTTTTATTSHTHNHTNLQQQTINKRLNHWTGRTRSDLDNHDSFFICILNVTTMVTKGKEGDKGRKTKAVFTVP